MTKFTICLRVGVITAILTPLTLLAQTISPNDRWDEGFGWYPLAGDVLTISAGACDMYVGGTIGGEEGENYVAKWDGIGWDRLGDASINGTVHAVVADGSEVYAGGDFSTIGELAVAGIARWDGTEWEEIGGGVEGGSATVHAIELFGSDLFVGGDFTSVNGVEANNIARWSERTQTWTPIATGVNGVVLELHVEGDWLYIGGKFTQADGNNAANIARYNLLNSTWQRLGSGVNDSVFTIEVTDRTVFAGGSFTLSGIDEVNHVASYDRVTGDWSSLEGGTDGNVHGLEMRDSVLYAVGEFTTIGSLTTTGIATWEDGVWSAVGSGLDGAALAIATCAERICVGGSFAEAGGFDTPHMAALDEIGWASMKPRGSNGLNHPARAVVLVEDGDGEFYAGGDFTTAGDLDAAHLARWTGSSWQEISAGVNGPVYTLSLDGNRLAVGGAFDSSASIPLRNIGVWLLGEQAWMQLDDGANGPVHTLLLDGELLYVGGDFSMVDTVEASNIAIYNFITSRWSALGGGTNGPIHALALQGSTLHVGGDFSEADGGTSGNYAAYNISGQTWSLLAPGMNAPVRALNVAPDGKLYAGGDFTTTASPSYDRTTEHVAINDGDDWRGLEGGLDGGVTISTVYSIASVGESIFFGGEFTLAGGVPIGYLARWRESWIPLGSGIDGVLPVVYDVDATDEFVAVAGDFSAAGEKASVNIALWDERASGSVHGSRGRSQDGLAIGSVRSEDQVLLEITSTVEGTTPGEVVLVDISGRTISTTPIERVRAGRTLIEVDRNDLPSGTYLIRLRAGSLEAHSMVVIGR